MQVCTDWLIPALTFTPPQAYVPDLNAPVELAFSLVKSGYKSRARPFSGTAAAVEPVLGQRNGQAV